MGCILKTLLSVMMVLRQHNVSVSWGSANFDPCVSLFCCQHWRNFGPEVFQALFSESALHCANTAFRTDLWPQWQQICIAFALLLPGHAGLLLHSFCVVCLAWADQRLSCAA